MTVVTHGLQVIGRLRGSVRVEAEGVIPPPRLQWRRENSTTVAVLDFQTRWYPHVDAVHRRIPDGKNVFTMPESMRVDARELAAKARADIDAEADPRTRGLLRAQHMAFFFALCHQQDEAPGALQNDLAAIVDDTSAVDLHFGLAGPFNNFVSAVGVAARGADAALAARTSRWFEQQAREHPVPVVAADAHGWLIRSAQTRGDTARLAEFKALAATPRFCDNRAAAVAASQASWFREGR